MRLILVTMAVVIQAVIATGTQAHGGAGSHSNMRQEHRHTKDEGQHQRHHVPKRSMSNANDYNDPKRPPPVLKNPKLLEDSKLVHDTSHIKEELPKYISPEKIKNMTPRELDYHYFKIHDFDDNRKLDGLELMKAIGHVHGDDHDDEEEEEEKYKRLSEAEKRTLKLLQRQQQEEDWKFYIELVDDVLEDNDKNKDGYLSYGEYVNGRNRNYGQEEYLENLD